MKKSKRARGVHTAVVLPPDVLEQLRRSERGVSEEVRRRVDRTLDEDAFDEQTRALGDAIMWIADEVSRQVGHPWHVTVKGRQAVAVAIQHFLEASIPPTESLAVELLFGPDDPPTLGRTIARSFQKFLSQIPRTPGEPLRIIFGRRYGENKS